MSLGKAELVALGLLADAPAYGYELLDRARARRMQEWAAVGRASVYQALDRLERRGFVQGRAQGGAAGPDRRVYRLTRAGRAGLAAEVTARLRDPGSYETPAGHALGFAAAMSNSGLDGYRDTLRARLASLATEPDDPVAAAMIARQRALVGADLAWLDAHRRALTTGR
ncbi:MAG TPA: PadR family transcriptional regulator [Actinomycetota bacterium]